MKLTLGKCAVLMTWVVVVLPVFAGVRQGSASPAGQQAQQKSAAVSSEAVEYKNTKYGFAFSLPDGWKGYSIVTNQWEATDAQKGVVERGPMIYIRHPEWTKENPRQDIPIVVFTLAQWTSVEHGDFFESGAPTRPSELGRNRKYVFALPSHFDDGDAVGVKEVEEILQRRSFHPFWSK
jgi:hypothetical protein